MRRSLIIVVTLVVAALSLTACSDDSGDTGTSGSGGGTTVDITIKDGKVTPNGERVKAKVGSPITLKIDADRAGEIHVHSTPEQEVRVVPATTRVVSTTSSERTGCWLRIWCPSFVGQRWTGR